MTEMGDDNTAVVGQVRAPLASQENMDESIQICGQISEFTRGKEFKVYQQQLTIKFLKIVSMFYNKLLQLGRFNFNFSLIILI